MSYVRHSNARGRAGVRASLKAKLALAPERVKKQQKGGAGGRGEPTWLSLFPTVRTFRHTRGERVGEGSPAPPTPAPRFLAHRVSSVPPPFLTFPFPREQIPDIVLFKPQNISVGIS